MLGTIIADLCHPAGLAWATLTIAYSIMSRSMSNITSVPPTDLPPVEQAGPLDANIPLQDLPAVHTIPSNPVPNSWEITTISPIWLTAVCLLWLLLAFAVSYLASAALDSPSHLTTHSYTLDAATGTDPLEHIAEVRALYDTVTTLLSVVLNKDDEIKELKMQLSDLTKRMVAQEAEHAAIVSTLNDALLADTARPASPGLVALRARMTAAAGARSTTGPSGPASSSS